MLQTFVGSFAQKTTTGNLAVTGVGFTPKIIFLFGNDKTSDGTAAESKRFFGVGISSSDRRSIFDMGHDNVGTSDVDGDMDDSKLIRIASNSASVLSNADLVSLDSDGFTVNFTTTDGTQRIIGFLALGGSDLSNVKGGTIQQKASTGNQGYTGVGFQPDCVILFQGYGAVTVPPSNQAGSREGIGFAVSSSKRAWFGERSQDGVNPSNTARYQSASKCIGTINSNTDAIVSEADLVSMDSDGFTLNWTTADANQRYYFYIALKGPRFSVGSFNQATSTGNQAVTGAGVGPFAIILASFNNATSSSVQTHLRSSLGIGARASQRMNWWRGGQDNVSNTQEDQNLDRTTIIKMMTSGSGSPSTEASADLVSLDGDGFTLNWGTADATAREIIYLAISGTLLPLPVNINQSVNRSNTY